MTATSLFLAWQDKNGRRWFPVGRLDADAERSRYEFRYTCGASAAERESGFAPLYDFPRFEAVYQSSSLFPLFENRVMTRSRKSFREYLDLLAIDDPDPDPLEILAVDGGYRMTDSFEVFPKIEKRGDGGFRCRFFLHGSRHTSLAARTRVNALETGEDLYIAVELTNPATQLAVQVQTMDYHMIGWAPRYLVGDLAQAMAHAPSEYKAQVVKANAGSLLYRQSVLVELSGRWPDKYEPMSSKSYQLLVAEREETRDR